MVGRVRWQAWGVVALFLWQSVAFSMEAPGSKPGRFRWGCSAIVAAAVVAGTVAGVYWHSWEGSNPAPVVLSHRVEPPVEVARDELSARLDALDVLLARESHLFLPLTAETGSPPELKLFDKNFIQTIIAGKVREKMEQKSPKVSLPPGPALRIPIKKLVLREAEGQPGHVRVGVRGDFLELLALKPVARAQLLSGNVVELELKQFRETIEGDGELVVEMKIAVRFVPETGAFEIVEGMSALRVTVPDRCNERDVASLPVARTAAVIAPRRP